MINYSLEDSLNYILINIENKIPFLMSRFGDGEYLLLNSLNDPEKFIRNCKKRLNWIPTYEEINTLRNYLIKTFENSNLIGVATERHKKLNSSWNKSEYQLKNDCRLKTNLFCSMDLHLDLLDNNYYEKILRNREKVFIVSGRDISIQIKNHFNIKEIEAYVITPETMFDSFNYETKHYPTQFYEIKDWIANLDCKESICLMGAGYIGKIYGLWFKERGGVSLDIGSVFDLWAGRCTRGKNRGIDIKNETYKL